MDTIAEWLNTLNLFNVLLTTLFTAWLTAKNSKRDMLKGIQVSERNKSEIIAEIRGEVASLRDMINRPKN